MDYPKLTYNVPPIKRACQTSGCDSLGARLPREIDDSGFPRESSREPQREPGRVSYGSSDASDAG
eukprot:8169077-Pyramimonas_sp.AAC.1